MLRMTKKIITTSVMIAVSSAQFYAVGSDKIDEATDIPLRSSVLKASDDTIITYDKAIGNCMAANQQIYDAGQLYYEGMMLKRDVGMFLQYMCGHIPSAGWKLHVALDRSDVKIILKVLQFLIDQKVSFKVVKSIADLDNLYKNKTQLGKVITIYPEDEKILVRITQDLDQLLLSFNLAEHEKPPYEASVGKSKAIFTRYGGFVSDYIPVCDRQGKLDSDVGFIFDRRDGKGWKRFYAPDFVTWNPFIEAEIAFEEPVVTDVNNNNNLPDFLVRVYPTTFHVDNYLSDYPHVRVEAEKAGDDLGSYAWEHFQKYKPYFQNLNNPRYYTPGANQPFDAVRYLAKWTFVRDEARTKGIDPLVYAAQHFTLNKKQFPNLEDY